MELIADKYKVKKKLGEGGFGTVYLAQHSELETLYAIKVFHSKLVQEESLVERFKREAKILTQLVHKNSVQLRDFGRTDDDGLYMAMDYSPGKSLGTLLREKGRLSCHRTLEIVIQVLEVVKEAHSLGIIHRDLKPDNIMLERRENGEEVVKVLDFGIAKLRESLETQEGELTQEGAIVGTPLYMSPEQAEGRKDIDARADLYSIGVIMYQMLSGINPFDGENFSQILIKQLTQYPPQFKKVEKELSVPDSVENLVFWALQKDREERPNSAREFLAQCQKVLVHLERDPSIEGKESPPAIGSLSQIQTQISSPPSTPNPRGEGAEPGESENSSLTSDPVALEGGQKGEKKKGRAPVFFALVAFLLLLGVGAYGLSYWQGKKEPPKKSPSNKKDEKIATEKKKDEKEGEKEKKEKYPGFTYLGEEKYTVEGETKKVKEYRHQKTGMVFVLVKGGTFDMGSPEGEPGRTKDEGPMRPVRVRSFLMSKYEVTQGTWKKIMGTSPWRINPKVKDNKGRPAEYISFYDARAFCRKTGLFLPTEEEWEYACRAGSRLTFYWGNQMDGRYGWAKANALKKGKDSAPLVGQKKPNLFGLYDMSGNVFEWTCSEYRKYSESPQRIKKSTGKEGVIIRGGSWLSPIRLLRSASRIVKKPYWALEGLGMRCVWSPQRAPLEPVPRVEKLDMAHFKHLREVTYAGPGVAYTVQEYLHNKTEMEFVLIPGGTFIMGGQKVSLGGKERELPRHEVTLSSFLISKYEVTQGVWKKIMGSSPWKGKKNVVNDPLRPAVNISWEEAREFCRRSGLHLPSESEWEYACRAGSSMSYFWGWGLSTDLPYVWYRNNIMTQAKEVAAQQVGRRKANAFGLTDVLGNVGEFCRDDWHENYKGHPADGSVWKKKDSSRAVARGGNWLDHSRQVRCSSRRPVRKKIGKNKLLGFRSVYHLHDH